MDKLTHAYNTYLIAELLHYRIRRNTGGAGGVALTAGLMASGLMALNEISDGIEPDSGYSMQDITMNFAGAAFSVLRNTMPGLKEKLAFKLEIKPNDQIYARTGKPHYELQEPLYGRRLTTSLSTTFTNNIMNVVDERLQMRNRSARGTLDA